MKKKVEIASMAINYFTLGDGEEARIQEGLYKRGRHVEDVVSVCWNAKRGCYVVWYK